MPVPKSPTVICLADLRSKIGATLDRLDAEERPIFLSRRGRTCAVLLSLRTYDELATLEAAATPPPARFKISEGDDAARVLTAIQAGLGEHPDALVEATGLSVSRVLVALTELQVNGLAVPPGRPRRSSVR